ncbi:Bug family tripartite tricarboxylate transporter substrate binding protein [Shinella kummerowiae]|uniref:Bug family tripartite tricarboxylate transporter substrate binding protein n=1 Tax=Shinella kummerowiae TaxID=417745 RepID=UPI0021B60C7F|nr:tripartite tricarboxylate transporter substrate binding protein [Shinella kummerowiae]MCT7664135.1 tripartite tricarboxylate transporter substrate binding protein [Shinella kummerowiae]
MSTLHSRRLGAYLLGACALASTLFTANLAHAFEPDRDVTVVVTSSAGGGSDTITRILTDTITKLKLTPSNFVVENRTGGSGAVGYSYTAKRKDDAYLWANIGVSFFTTPLLGESPVTYRDFTPLAAVSEDPYIMVVSKDSKIKSLADIKAAGKMVSGTTGIVADPALLAQRLETTMGIEADVVPFGGDGEVVAALLGGHIDVQFGNPSEVLPLIKSGDVRPIAVSAAERLPAFPDIPTIKESGYDVVLTQLRGFVMPMNAPEEAVAYWAEVIKKALESEQWKTQYLDRFNVVPKYMAGAELAAEMDKRNADYTALMTSLGLIK